MLVFVIIRKGGRMRGKAKGNQTQREPATTTKIYGNL